MIIVSHDRYLMDNVCDRILYLDKGRGNEFYKDFAQILKARDSHEQAAKKPVKKQTEIKKPKKRSSLSYKDQYELTHMEENILGAEEIVADLTEQVQDPAVTQNPAKLTDICAKLEKAEIHVQELYSRWEVLEDKKLAIENPANK